MEALHRLLASSPAVLAFTVIGLGWFVGNLRLAGFKLGIAGVLFVGLLFGWLDPQAFALPEVIVTLGLIVFVYTVGLQSGPLFFSLFRRQGLRMSALALLATGGTAVLAFAASRLLGIGAPVATGLYCGSLTNTPALAASVEALRQKLSGGTLDPAALRAAIDAPTVGYSIAYPFGVLGLILVMQLLPRLTRTDLARERERGSAMGGIPGEDLQIRDFRVTNPQVAGRTLAEAMLTELTGVVFTRVKQGDAVELVEPDRRLVAGDVLVGVGSPEAIRRAELLVGPLVSEQVDRLPSEIGFRDLLVIDRKVVGWTVRRLSAAVGAPVIVSRIRRGGVGITPGPEATLELGDQIRVVAHERDLERVTQLVGNPIRDYSEADFLSFSLGLVLGVIVGTIPIPIPGGTVALGLAGGPMVVALVLGRLGRTGRIVWTMPPNANLTLRQLGIVLFLAGVGTRAGASFVATLQQQGPQLLLVGAAMTAISALASVLVAWRVFGYDLVSSFGILSGIHTQPAALAFANTHTGSETPNHTYAAVYPVALISKIILAQVLVLTGVGG